MNNAQQRIAECHTGQALCIVHLRTRMHITRSGFFQFVVDHLDRMQR